MTSAKIIYLARINFINVRPIYPFEPSSAGLLTIAIDHHAHERPQSPEVQRISRALWADILKLGTAFNLDPSHRHGIRSRRGCLVLQRTGSRWSDSIRRWTTYSHGARTTRQRYACIPVHRNSCLNIVATLPDGMLDNVISAYAVIGMSSAFGFRAVRKAIPNNPAAQEQIIGASLAVLAIADVSAF